MFTTNHLQSWTLLQKIIFRFLFLFLGFFLLNYELAMVMIDLGFYKKVAPMYGVFAQPLHWLDTHFYHVGYNPELHASIPGDNHFGIVFFLTSTIIFILIVIAWSIIDRRKNNYHKLNYWFRIYVRYMVALILFSYGMEKVMLVQMGYPQVTDLLTPLGDQSRFNVIWNFVGVSPAYERFTGTCEVIASLLLIFNRTYIFGSLFMFTVLSNVVALNFFYNIPVKLYSSLLLTSVLYLLAPYTKKFVQLFFQGRAVSFTEKHYRFERNWKKYVVIAVGIFIPALSFVNDSYEIQKIYTKVKAGAADQKLYDVLYFIKKDTLQPLITDTIRWRRFAFISKKSLAVYNMQDKADFYDCDMDTVKHTCRLHNNNDSTKWDVLHYSYPQKNLLQLAGSWKGGNVNILMKEVPIDSMKLNKEKITFVQE